GGVGRRVGLQRDEHLVGLGAETVAAAVDVIMTVIVVLIEDADLTVGLGVHDVATIAAALGAVGRLPADGPREMLGIVATRRARTGEQLRNALGVEIFMHSHVGRGADAVEDQ